MTQPTSTPQNQSPSAPLLPLRTALILLAAAFFGLIAGGLTFAGVAGTTLAGALLAGLGVSALSVPALHSLIG